MPWGINHPLKGVSDSMSDDRLRRSFQGMLFKGFDIPLQMVSGEKFEQPILFGANNLSGIVQTNVAYAGARLNVVLLPIATCFHMFPVYDAPDCHAMRWSAAVVWVALTFARAPLFCLYVNIS